MRAPRALPAIGVAVLLSSVVRADVNGPPLVADAVLRSYASIVSGDRAFNHVARLATLHRLPATAAFDGAAAYVVESARAAGLDVQVSDYPADGTTEVWTWRSFPEWEARAGELSWATDDRSRIASFADSPVSLAAYSESVDITADVVDIGPGYRDSDYEGKDVRGKLVFTNGFPSMVRQKAVVDRGAAGIITWYNEATQPDAAAWLSLPLDHSRTPPSSGTFAFVLSFFQGRPIKQALDRGEPVRLRAHVDATTRAGHYRVVSAVIPGERPDAGEIWFTAHLDHQEPGANDNASGSAAILEVATSLQMAIRNGTLPRPTATLRFLWGPEMIGNVLFVHDHPDAAARAIVDFNLDTVGENQTRLGTSLWVIRPPASRAHYAADVAENFAQYTLRNNRRLLGGRPDGPFISARGGSRAVLNAAVVPYVGGSDNVVFNDGAIAIPAIGYIHYPDPTWHTNVDKLDYVDATTLARAVFMTGASAIALGWPSNTSFDALLRNTEALGDVRLAQARSAARVLLVSGQPDAHHEAAMVIDEAYRDERDAVESLAGAPQFADRWRPALRRAGDRLDVHLALDRRELELASGTSCEVKAHQALGTRRPIRTGWKGPLDQYRNVLASKLPASALAHSPAASQLSSVALYEALNFADGRTPLIDIYHRVAGECLLYHYPLPPAPVFQDFFDLLEQANLITWQ